MDSGCVTTPFGRRPMSLGMLASQQLAETIEPGTKRSKWKLFRAICEARPALGVTDRALTVLDALLTFYPDDEISEETGLIVFPSNAQLSLRARGMTAATLRRHLAVLVEVGLIVRKIEASGLIRVERVGGVPEKALPAQEVVLALHSGRTLPGVIANKSHHATLPEERYEVVPYQIGRAHV